MTFWLGHWICNLSDQPPTSWDFYHDFSGVYNIFSSIIAQCKVPRDFNKYMLFSGWEVRVVKNCDRGLENAARSCRPRSQFFTIRTDHKPISNLVIFFQALKRIQNSRKKTSVSVTVTVVRDRKIRTALRTNKIVGFVTVSACKNISILVWVLQRPLLTM